MYLCLFQRGWKSGNIDSTGCIHVLVLERMELWLYSCMAWCLCQKGWKSGNIHGTGCIHACTCSKEGVELWLYLWNSACQIKGGNLAIFLYYWLDSVKYVCTCCIHVLSVYALLGQTRDKTLVNYGKRWLGLD